MKKIIKVDFDGAYTQIAGGDKISIPRNFEMAKNEIALIALSEKAIELGIFLPNAVQVKESGDRINLVNTSNKYIALVADIEKFTEDTKEVFDKMDREAKTLLNDKKAKALKDDMDEFNKLVQYTPPTYEEWMDNSVAVFETKEPIAYMVVKKIDEVM